MGADSWPKWHLTPARVEGVHVSFQKAGHLVKDGEGGVHRSVALEQLNAALQKAHIVLGVSKETEASL